MSSSILDLLYESNNDTKDDITPYDYLKRWLVACGHFSRCVAETNTKSQMICR